MLNLKPFCVVKFSQEIEKKGGLGEFELIDLMEWFMKSMIDVMDAMDLAMKSDSNETWPRYQTLKKLFTQIVKPIEQLAVNLFPLPPYKSMT